MLNFVLVEGDHPYTVARIAQCFDKLGNKNSAKEWAARAVKLHAKDSDMEEAIKECQRILK